MEPFTQPKRERIIAVRDLKPGDQIVSGAIPAVVERIEITSGYIFLKKAARAVRIHFLNRDAVIAHPAQRVELV